MENETENSTGSSGGDQHTKAQEFKNSGNDKFNKNNYKGALVDYKKGLLHEPNNSDLHANLAAAYIHLEKYIEAEEHAVYAIHLRPNFYKGYMRAAKAAHGKGMTKLALKRLATGLSLVTDANGVKELTRLKTQYTAYLSLERNAERELDFDSDRYQSEDDEDEERFSEDDEEPEEDLPVIAVEVEPIPPVNEDRVPANVPEKITPAIQVAQLPKEDVIEQDPSKPKSSAAPKVEPLSKEEKNKTVEELPKVEDKLQKVEEAKPAGEQSKSVENDKTDKKSDRFLDMCKELSKDPELKKHVSEFKEHLKNGSEAFLSGNYRKAVDCYRAAKERVGIKITEYEIDDRQFHVIKYANCVALINLDSYDDIVKAIQNLTEMEVYKFSIPALYIQMARAYCKLNRFKTALEPLEKLQEILDNCPIFPTFTWPGTTETIVETTPAGLKNAVKELNQTCRMSHKPTAVCRFDNCLKTSTHILPSELIYLSDPDFVGYVRMVCEEKCHIEFHISCWKSYKEVICGIGKINDKDFLGRRCLTTDCVNSDGEPSVITVIEIIGNDGQVKSVNKLDPKPSVDFKKTKKKKAKLDDKDKSTKPKKTKEKKIREIKKPAAAVEDEEEPSGQVRAYTDHGKALQTRLQSLAELRKIKFGMEDKYWNPKMASYGREDESVKASISQYWDKANNEPIEVRHAKEFLFSYFTDILKDEGPLNQSEIEDLWKKSAGDFCDITVVLPNLKSMCELLLESTRFCQLEDYICLSEQLEEAYLSVKTEVSETVNFLMTGSTPAGEDSQQTPATSTKLSGALPDLLHHPQSLNNQSSSEDESDSEEYNSGADSEESDEDETSDTEEAANMASSLAFELSNAVPEELEIVIPPQKPFDDGKLSLRDVLNEMNRVKNLFMEDNFNKKAAEDGDTKEDSNSNETFATAHASSQNATDDAKYNTIPEKGHSESSNDDQYVEVFSSDEMTGGEGETDVLHISPSPPEENNSSEELEIIIEEESHSDELPVIITEEESNNYESLVIVTEEEPVLIVEDGEERDKTFQVEVLTEERQIQTTPKETMDRLSQTMESDLYKDLKLKLEALTSQVEDLANENANLAQENSDKDIINKQLKNAQDETLARMQEENQKNLEKHKSLQNQLKAEFSKKESEFVHKENELLTSMGKMKELYDVLVKDHDKLSKEMSSLMKDTCELKKSLESATSNIRELEANNKALEKNMKTKLQKSLQLQLQTIKAYWDNQINLLRKRCVEKISEMQNWFTMFPPEEVEDLPSWGLIRQNTLQWSEISKKVQQLEGNFQVKYSALETKIIRGEEVDDLTMMILPTLPDEPTPIPLDKIHKEITEKHLKKINELTQLVVNQQLEINKNKDNKDHQLQQLMNYQQMVPRMQTPMTTAFGGLALQYPYPQATMGPQFNAAPIPTIPPRTQDSAKVGSTSKMMQSDVQTLLQECSKTAKFISTATPEKPENASGSRQKASVSKQYQLSYPPPLTASAPGLTDTKKAMPPPPVGVAHNVLKTSNTAADKKDLNERSSTPKPDSRSVSSRETTPVSASANVQTPEKSKKKKKSRSKSREALEAKIASVPVLDTASGDNDAQKDDDTAWNVVLPKSAMPKHPAPQPPPVSESKLKNKKRLLDKLQMKFPTTPLKDLDDIIKLVREQNNGSLSGLPFDEIETRVERYIIKKHYQKNSRMGLDKFSEAAWGPVKQQEIITWTSLQLEECTICLEPMGNDRTKVDCNHEFHTKCLRKWLKEKSVCPLCNKFTTMPDEFPAL